MHCIFSHITCISCVLLKVKYVAKIKLSNKTNNIKNTVIFRKYKNIQNGIT